VGDPLYGSAGQPLENLPGLPGDGGYFLHAQYLKFHHPITGEKINLEAALPSGFPESAVAPAGFALKGQ
jgi:23S rRNA pseudouridine1911/1915/1917 synthase